MSRRSRKRKRAENEIHFEEEPSDRKRKLTPVTQVLEDDVLPIFRKGKILKMTLHNFMTYKHVTLKPGPGLNLILGPNGTGKSSLVNAFCIGLAGDTRLLGRGSSLKSFIRHGANDCYIEVELHRGKDEDDEDKKPLVIRRTIKINNSRWKMNGKQATLSEVVEEMEKYNINFGNLTQFLPQDKVSQFASLTPKDILKWTQIALIGESSTKAFEELVEKQKSTTGSNEKIASMEKDLLIFNRELEVLKGKMDEYLRRVKHINMMKKLQLKIYFVQFSNRRNMVGETRAKYNNARTEMQKFMDNQSPLAMKIEKLQNERANRKIVASKYRKKVREVEERLENLNRRHNKHSRISTQCQQKLSQLIESQESLETQKQQLKNDIANLERGLQSLQNEDEAKKSLKETSNNVKREDAELEKYYNERNDIGERKDELKDRLKRLNRELQRMRDQKRNKERKVRNWAPFEFSVYEWCRRNQARLEGKVWFVSMSVDLKIPKYGYMLEFHIPNKTWKTFVVETENDKELLIKTFVETSSNRKSNNTLNILINDTNYDEKPHPVALEVLKRNYGVECYLSEVFTCPPKVMDMLYRTRDVPIANSDRHFEQMFRNTNIRVAFTMDTRFKHNVSIYGGKRSTMQNPVSKRDPRILSVLNKDRANQITNEMKDIDQKVSEEELKMNSVLQKEEMVQSKIDSFKRRQRELRKVLSKYKKIRRTLANLKGDLEDLDEMNYEEREKEILIKLRKSNHERQSLSKKICSTLREWMAAQDELVKARIQEELCRYKVQQLLNQQKEEVRLKNDLKKKCDMYLRDYNELKAELKRLKERAMGEKMKYMEEKAMNDDQVKEMLMGFDDNLEVLNTRLQHEQDEADKIVGNQGSVDMYEEKKKAVEKIKADLKLMQDERENVSKVIREMEDKWLQPLKVKIDKVSITFDNFCRGVGICGELRLKLERKNYEDSRLEIWVKFRDSENLSILQSTRQSGGEKSVTTMLYMLALQRETKSPFLVVDEINQGMDPINERKVFEQMIRSCHGRNVPQSFLITPKLLPNLVPGNAKNISIFFIFNGTYALNDKQQQEFDDHIEKM